MFPPHRDESFVSGVLPPKSLPSSRIRDSVQPSGISLVMTLQIGSIIVAQPTLFFARVRVLRRTLFEHPLMQSRARGLWSLHTVECSERTRSLQCRASQQQQNIAFAVQHSRTFRAVRPLH